MKILLINPWLKTLFGDEKTKPGHPHLGLAYLIAVLKEHGSVDIDIFDQGIEEDDKVLFKKLNASVPDLIGMTSYSYCADYAVKLINRIKEYKDIPLIIGGPHVSAINKDILTTTAADFAMKGESEASFIAFITEFSGSKQYSKVGNLIWRDISGTIVENEIEPLIDDIDQIPFPSYDLFEFERYSYYAAKTIPIITSRGCPYGCNYCSVKLSMGRGFRMRSPENVIKEMKYWIKKYGTERFEVNDDCFTLDLKRAEKICDLILEEGLNIKYEMYNGIRADRVTERLLRKMKASGCIFVSYGCESGNQGVINNMGKALKIEKIVEAVELTRKVGIRNSVNFIIGHRGETYATAMETIRFAKSLPTDFVNFYNAIPYPGTDLYNWVSENATYMMPVDEYLGNVGSRDLTPVFWTKDFSREERIEALKKGYALYEESILKFRFGRFVGSIAYLVSRNRWLFTIGRKIALGSNLGFKIYAFLTRGSRKV